MRLLTFLFCFLFSVRSFGAFAPMFTNGATLWVDPNGNDALAKRGIQAFPFKTIPAAVTAAQAGDTILIESGIYDIGTNNLSLPANSVFRGVGVATVIKSEGAFKVDTVANPTHYKGGCVINPGNNCEIRDLTIWCNTNNCYWAAIGTINNGTILQQSFTNVVVRNVVITNAMSDAFYLEHAQLCTMDVYDSVALGHWDVVALATAPANSLFRFYSCRFFNDVIGGGSMNTGNTATIVNLAQGQVQLYNCTGIATNAVTPNGLLNQSANHALQSWGGYYWLYPTNASSVGFYAGSASAFSVDGDFTMNGTRMGLAGSASGSTIANSDTTIPAGVQYDFTQFAYRPETSVWGVPDNTLLIKGGLLSWDGAGSIGGNLKVSGGVITNGTVAWYVTNNTPTFPAAAGSICTRTDNGAQYYRSNGVWNLH